jgi:hypothetical protein
MAAPKLFISYSWSNPEHEQWVINLATELRQSGVDAILDKWDLKEGHDAVAFMEQMVTNPEIKKVAMICDEKYTAKADGRAGGVGTETQIISRSVYENQAQEKFVAVISEKDAEGKPFLPTYYKSRIYIDLSDGDKYAENFERLVRWVFDKPLYAKPELGGTPAYLREGEHVSLGTTALFKRCVDALKNQKAYAAGAFDEYCNAFAANLERFRLSKPDGELDEAIIKNIEEFLPYRNEAVQLFIAVAQYSPSDEFVHRLHRFFESLIPYMSRPENVSQWEDWAFDNYKFIVHELFLYALAVLIKHERFDQANYLLQQQYYLLVHEDGRRNVMVNFVVFRKHMRSLEYRNKRLKLGRLSIRADLLNVRCAGTGIDARHLLQADFVAFMRAEIENRSRWWPETLLYVSRFGATPFEIFARSVSESYFNRVKVLLAIKAPKDIDPLLNSYQDGSRKLPNWDFEDFSPAGLLGYENLATRP